MCSGIDEDNMCIENKKLAILFASQKRSEFELFTELKTAIIDIAQNLMGIELSLGQGETVPYLHPVNSFRIKSRTADYGYIGVLHPEVNKSIDKRFSVVALEIDFEKLSNTVAYARKIKSVSKYQSVSMDYNLLVSEDMLYEDLQKALHKFKSKIMTGYSLVDIYENKEVLKDKKSVTLRFELCSNNHTLSGEEIEKFRADFAEYLSKNKLEIRG